MAATHLAALLLVLRDRIVALTPRTRVAGEADNRFRVSIGTRNVYSGSRAVIISAEPGVKAQRSATCDDWLARVTIEAYYLDTLPESDDSSVYLRAVEDAEQIARDLYAWAAAASDGVLQIVVNEASIVASEGELGVVRSFELRYRGGG